MKKLGFIAIIIAMTTFCFAEKVTLATGEWSPFTSESLPEFGFASEIVKEAFNVQGIEVEFKFFPWKRCEALVKNGEVLATFPYKKTEKRSEKFIFSKSILTTKNFFYYVKNGKDFQYEDLSDLQGYKIGGVLGYFYKPIFEKAGLNVEYSSKEVHCLKKLLAGRIDLYPGNQIPTWELIKNELPDQVDKFATLPKPFLKGENHLMFSKDNPMADKYIEIFNKGLKKIKDSGKYDKIVKKHGIKLTR